MRKAIQSLIIGVMLLFVFPVMAANKIALVIGNSQYNLRNGSLVNAARDARAVAKALTQLGFEVNLKIDLNDQEAMEIAVDDFSRQLAGKEIGLFYYAGHAVQYNNRNYLIPVRENIANARQIKHRALELTYLLDQMNAYRSKTGIVILDSCRDNPFPKAIRSVSGRGLGRVSAPGDMLIVYSTKAGATAEDGKGRHSPYTETLLHYLEEAAYLPLTDFFNQIAVAVENKTNFKQSPRLYSAPLHHRVCLGTCVDGGVWKNPNPLLSAAQKETGNSFDLPVNLLFLILFLILLATVLLFRNKPETHSGPNRNLGFTVQSGSNFSQALLFCVFLAAAGIYYFINSDINRKQSNLEKIINPIPEKFPVVSALPIIEANSQPKEIPGQKAYDLALSSYDAGNYPAALNFFNAAHEQGNVYATAMLAKLYAWGSLGVNKDVGRAERLRDQVGLQLTRRAKSGIPEAQFYLAGMLEALDKNLVDARHWYQLAAEQGHTGAQNNLGLLYQQKTSTFYNPEQAFFWFRKAAEAGNRLGQFNLGESYINGNGIEQDDNRAFFWIRKSAEQDYPKAQALLGYMYKKGRGVNQDYRKALVWLRKSAEHDNTFAQKNLGLMYQHGLGVSQDYGKAVAWYRKAAEKGNAKAQNHLGMMYFNGYGVPKNDREAYYWYKKAAGQGDAYAQNNLGTFYLNGLVVIHNDQTALHWFQLSARQDNALAQKNLGWMYENGRGVSQDDKTAFEWYRKAAEQALPEAQFKVGHLYELGKGVVQNYRQAFHWYRLAAEQNFALAQNNLGLLYQYGQGVRQNRRTALHYFQLAAEQNASEAQVNLGRMYEAGKGVHMNKAKAAELYLQAAEQGHSGGQYNLARLYKEGIGLRKNDEQALYWYRQAAQQDDTAAQVSLGWMYEYGRGVAQNDRIAGYWYRKAAEAGNAQGQNNLGWLYKYGRGVKQSDRLAVIWFRKAAEQGNAAGQNNLAVMYELGRGVPRNRHKAVYWYELASKQGNVNAYDNLKALCESLGQHCNS